MDNFKFTTCARREITVKGNEYAEHIKAVLVTKELDGRDIVQAGLNEGEVVNLVKGLLQVSGIPLEMVEEALNPPKAYYVLPPLYITDSMERFLNVYVIGKAVGFATNLQTDFIQTKFTEEEFQSLVEEHPELSVLIKEDI